jgi:hypothetical protein
LEADIAALQAQDVVLAADIVAAKFAPYPGAVYHEFEIQVANNSGTIQHRMQAPNNSSSSIAITGNLASLISGAANSYTTTPNGTDATTPFAAGAKISSASPHVLILDTPEQTNGNFSLNSEAQNIVAGTNGRIYTDTLSFNVNGVTRVRPGVVLSDVTTGGALTWASALNSNGENIRIRISGWLQPAV